MTATLSILICTLPERTSKLRRLLNVLQPQVDAFSDRVGYRINDAGRNMPTGTKRNQLIAMTQSDYFVFIDDDDVIMPNYVKRIVHAMDLYPDVITFRGWMTTNGTDRRNWTIKLGSKYEERDGHYYRWPNHIVPMRREAIKDVRFPDIWVQEDYQWSKRIHDLKLLKTEIHIDQELYHYDCNPQPAQRRPRIRR
jgi:glycosyltransferase involved in cell wall biosynthesis